MKNVSSLSSGSSIVRINDGASRFLLSLYETRLLIAFYNSSKIDIMGGISSSQWELVFMTSQEALDRGITAYLVSKGCKKPRTLYQSLKLLACAAEGEKELYQEAHDLVLANPDSPQEIEEYAHKCIDFIEDQLGIKRLMKELGVFASMSSMSEHFRYELMSYAILKGLEILGLVDSAEPQVRKDITDKTAESIKLRDELAPFCKDNFEQIPEYIELCNRLYIL